VKNPDSRAKKTAIYQLSLKWSQVVQEWMLCKLERKDDDPDTPGAGVISAPRLSFHKIVVLSLYTGKQRPSPSLIYGCAGVKPNQC